MTQRQEVVAVLHDGRHADVEAPFGLEDPPVFQPPVRPQVRLNADLTALRRFQKDVAQALAEVETETAGKAEFVIDELLSQAIRIQGGSEDGAVTGVEFRIRIHASFLIVEAQGFGLPLPPNRDSPWHRPLDRVPAYVIDALVDQWLGYVEHSVVRLWLRIDRERPRRRRSPSRSDA